MSRLMRAGISCPLKNPTMSLESLAPQNIPSSMEYSQLPTLLQPRAGQEPARAQGLRLPRDRRHSLQRCPDLITSDTDSSETRLNLAVGLILKEALGACWEKQMFQLLFQHFMWIDRFPFPVAEPNPVPAAFSWWQISSTDRESSTSLMYL